MGARDLRESLRRPGAEQLPASLAPFGPEVDQPVARADHVEVVLDHQHAVARVHEPLEHPEKPLDVAEMAHTAYDIHHYQPVLFAGQSLGHVVDVVGEFWARVTDESAAINAPR